MKKLLPALLACSVSVFFAGCSSDDAAASSQNSSEPVSSQTVLKDQWAGSWDNKKVSPAWKKSAVLSTMEAVADWQIEHPSRHAQNDWTQATGYLGFLALSEISRDPVYEQLIRDRCDEMKWQLARNYYHADNQCVAQVYLFFYEKDKNPAMIAPTMERFDQILAKPITRGLEHQEPGYLNHRWSWCDSLFMAPPAWLKLGLLTGNNQYIEFMDKEWKATTDYLYDKDENLFFRDSRFFDKREPNGAKIFWSRGNGWVMGGLVGILKIMPKDSPLRPYYEKQYKEMAAKILSIQQSSGFWSTSLLDSSRVSIPETSGTGFYCYTLAWGINNGLLPKAKYEPAVKRSWEALVSCVQTNGKLTHVQPIAADPFKFNENATEIYGVGAFLLAGSEIYKMAESE
ncbi:MAG: glycoside hydrolase family 88 protein [Puniceicoccales bacterium]|jgi:rhamnogalacturonyl hydrolase YesR|nr:glycoside hydrolase family 88 protein [Puniceicoccales bacterium]